MDLWSAIFTVIRRWYVSLPILAIAVVAMFAVGGKIQPDYEAKASIVLNPPVRKIVQGQEQTFRNQYAEDTQTLAAAVYRQINSSDEQRRLDEDGFSPRYEVELDQFSAIMDFTVTGSSPEQALDTANQLIRESERTALAIQRQAQPPEDELVNVDAVSLPVDAALVPGSKTRVMATILLLGLVGAASAAFIVESLLTRRRQGTFGSSPHVDPAYAYVPYPQLPPGAYAAPAPLPGPYPAYTPVMPVPAAQPTPVRPPAPTTAPAAATVPAPAYAGANGYAAPPPVAEPVADPESQALDSLLAEVEDDREPANRRSSEGQIINRGRTTNRTDEPAGPERRSIQPFEGPGDEPDAPILVGAGEVEVPETAATAVEPPAADTTPSVEPEVEVEVEVEASDAEATGTTETRDVGAERGVVDAPEAFEAPETAEVEASEDVEADEAAELHEVEAAEASEPAAADASDGDDDSGAGAAAQAEPTDVEQVDEALPTEGVSDDDEPSDAPSDQAAAEHADQPSAEQATEPVDEDTARAADEAAHEPAHEPADDDHVTVPERLLGSDALAPAPVLGRTADDAAPAQPAGDETAESGTDGKPTSEPTSGTKTKAEPVPAVRRADLPERHREPGGGGRQRGGRGPGGDRGNGRGGSNSGSGRNANGGGRVGGGGERGGSVRNGGNSRSTSRRNRRSLFAPQAEAAGSDGGSTSGVPSSGVTAEASAPDGD